MDNSSSVLQAIDLDQLQALYDATTQEAWANEGSNRVAVNGGGIATFRDGAYPERLTPAQNVANASFAVQAHGVFPQLLEELRHLRKENDGT